MPRPPSDVFRPRLPLDPFAAVDVRVPWLVPHNLPHSPPQVILILGEPPPSELLPLLTSPHLARSLLLIASHSPPPLPLLPPTIPGPAVRILRLSAPLSIHDAGALRLVALLEKAHRVATRWRLASHSHGHGHGGSLPLHLMAASSSSASLASGSWGPGRSRGGWAGASSGSAADRVVQLAEAPKTGEFALVEPVVYLPPPTINANYSPPATTTGSAAAAPPGGPGAPSISSADSRAGDNTKNNHQPHRHQPAQGHISGSPPPARPSPTALPTPHATQNLHHPSSAHLQHEIQQETQNRYPSPAPSIAESLSSASHAHAGPSVPASASLGPHTKRDVSSLTASRSTKRFSTLSPSVSPDISPPPTRPTSSYSVSSMLSVPATAGVGGTNKKLHRMRSSNSSLSLTSSLSHSHPNLSGMDSISPFAASVKTSSSRSSSKKMKSANGSGIGQGTRAFDAILNFLPAGVPDKQLLKHAILVTTLGVRYLESDGGHHAHAHQHSGSLGFSTTTHPRDGGYASDTGAGALKPSSSRRFSALSVFSVFASSSTPNSVDSSPASSVPSSPGVGVRSTPDLVSALDASPSGSTHSLLRTASAKRQKPRSSYYASSSFNMSADTEEEGDTEVETQSSTTTTTTVTRKEKRKSMRKRISALLAGASDEKELRRPESVYSRSTVEAEEMGLASEGLVGGGAGSKGKRASFFGGSGVMVHGQVEGKMRAVVLTAHIVHVLPFGWVDVDALSLQESRRGSAVPSASGSGSGVEMAMRAGKTGAMTMNNKPKLVQSVEQFLLSFAYPLGSLGALGSSSSSSSGSLSSKGKEKDNLASNGRPLRPPPSAYPGAGSRSSSSGSGGNEPQHHQGHLSALAHQHVARPVPYLVAPGVWGAPIPCEGEEEGFEGDAEEVGAYIPGHNAHIPGQNAHIPGQSAHIHTQYGAQRPLTYGEALLLGALDVDPLTGSRAGVGRAWVGRGDVKVVASGGSGAVALSSLPAVPAIPASVSVLAHAMAPAFLHPQGQTQADQAQLQVRPKLEDKHNAPDKEILAVQLPTPPESRSSSRESVVGEDEEDDSESTEKGKDEENGDGEVTPLAGAQSEVEVQAQTKPDLQVDTDANTDKQVSGLARRPTRNHRPAPPPPSAHSPVRAALQSLARTSAEDAPPAMIVVDATATSTAGVATSSRTANIVAAAAVVGASPAFPSMKGVAQHLELVKEARPPTRPRTIHVSDAHRAPPPVVGPVGASGLNRTASQSTSALLRGPGGKAGAGVPREEKSGKEKGYTHGLQAALRRLVVWRGGREKSAQKV